jgi:hypothetical protein
MMVTALGCGDDGGGAAETTGATDAATTSATTSGGSTGDTAADSTGTPGNGWEERATQLRFDPAAEEFWRLPLPSDLRREADGTFDVDKWPGAVNSTLVMWLQEADVRLTEGWGVGGGVLTTFTGGIDPTSLPEDGAPTLAPEASVYLLDIDPSSPTYGERLPLRLRFTADPIGLSEPNTLSALPYFGFVRRVNTAYALVVTDAVRDDAGDPIGRSEAFHLAFEGDPAADAATVEHLAPLRAALVDLGLDADAVAGAAVFTTGSPPDALRAITDWAETQPTPPLAEPWTVAEDYESYQVLTARFTVPVVQNGERPYTDIGEGLIQWGDDGTPQIQSTQDVRLALTIPKVPMPAEGFPLTMYLHGSGGEYYEAIDRGPRDEKIPNPPQPPAGTGPSEWLARRGVATVALDFPLHGDRNDPPDITGLKLYNIFGNVGATIDNFNVSAMELTLLSRLMLETSVDESLAATLDAGGAVDGQIRFDPARLTAMGHSMGSTLGIRWAAVDPRLQGAVWSGSGGTLTEIALHAVEPLDLKPVVAGMLGIAVDDFDDSNPLLTVLQHTWDFADPTSVAAHLTQDPFPGREAKQTMMTAGFLDGYFYPTAQAAIAVGLGVSIVGESVEPIVPAALELAGHPPVAAPLTADAGPINGMIHAAAPNTLGHYIVFNQDAPRYQYTCFLASVGTPGGAVIAGPAALDAACPSF